MKYVVVGAGISGLAAAHTLRHHDVTVLDAAAHVGGRMCSQVVGSVTMELGAQFLSSHYDVVPRLASELGIPLQRVDPGTAVVRHGTLRRFRADRPLSQFTAGVLPWRAGPRAAIGLGRVARLSSDRAASDLTAWVDVDHEGGDVWAARTFGGDVADRVLAPTINGFYFQSLAGSSAALPAAVASFGVRPGSTLSIAGGLGRLPQALAAGLDIRLGTAALEVRRDRDGAVVTTPGGRLRADRVILALPGPAAARVLTDADAVESALMATPYSSGLVVGLPLARPLAPQLLGGAYGVLVHPSEATTLAAVAVASRAQPDAEADLLTVMFEHSAALAMQACDDQAVVTATLDALRALQPALGKVLTDTGAGARVVRHPQAMPTCSPGHAAAVASYRSTRHASPVILAGDYLGFPWTDSAAATGIWAATTALGRS